MAPGVVITPIDVLTKAVLDPLPSAMIALTLGWYLWSVRRLAAKGRTWPVGRTIAFCAAELALVLGLLSGIDAFDDVSFTDHVVQHILIGMLAPIFFALSAPVTLALQASGRRVQTVILKVLHSPVGRVLSNPIVTWCLFGVSLFAYYFTSLYAYSLRNQTFHELVHLHLIVTGSLFFWPAIGVDPLPTRMSHWMRMLYMLLSMPFHTILGMALQSQTTPIAPNLSLSDLHSGGALMWVAGEATGLITTLAIFVQWLRADERAAKRSDRVNEAAAAAQLAHWRAVRDAATRAAARTAAAPR